MGIIVLTAPSTGSFLAVNPFATVFLCLFKTAVAGLICGWIFKALRKKSFSAAIIVASLACPMINTGIFAGGCMLFFLDTLKEWAGGSNVFSYLFLTMIGVNFLVEFAINSFYRRPSFTLCGSYRNIFKSDRRLKNKVIFKVVIWFY